MPNSKETHIVEIPVHQENYQNQQTKTAIIIQQHPMMEISQSPGHLLLLKLWQREELLFTRRILLNETKLDHLRREIFQLCCYFLVFHSFITTLLFTSSSTGDAHSSVTRCHKWWVPSIFAAASSGAIVFLVQVKLWRYWKVTERLRREKNDSRTLGRSIQELRMKGASFDLSKAMNFVNSKKAKKSSSVEIKWKPKIWCSNNLVTFCLVLFAGLAFPAPKLFLCII
ncbi:uncharacterized protein LOC104887689 [Beta vulgaris subsp. vulgaris]|uniref:uncharacterized protein LOC104887689 n=1 Tax=Beta vulgaris subsp. vulgaris TaxID=3555 RepID=UPI002037138D|nr:uncharacterized protein LOC104887689 [Beta vulgaris subsp. vulgaris]